MRKPSKRIQDDLVSKLINQLTELVTYKLGNEIASGLQIPFEFVDLLVEELER